MVEANRMQAIFKMDKDFDRAEFHPDIDTGTGRDLQSNHGGL